MYDKLLPLEFHGVSKQCDGDWEHLYGVKIDTLDNPGWSVAIDLADTVWEDKAFETMQIYNDENDWIYCSVKQGIFKGGGDPDKLEKIFNIFKNWVQS